MTAPMTPTDPVQQTTHVSAPLTMEEIQRAVLMGMGARHGGPGHATPDHPQPIQYMGPPMPTPENRQGTPLLSESLLQSLMASCTMSNTMRPAPQSIFRPQFMRTVLPVSSLGAAGAVPTSYSMQQQSLRDETTPP